MNTPLELVNKLAGILSDELRVHGDLVETARRLNEAIKRKSLEEIAQLTQVYDSLAGHVEELEEKRLAASDACVESSGLGKRHLSLPALIGLPISEPLRPALLKLRTLLREKVMELSRLNIANYILLEASLSAVAKSFDLMLNTREKFQVYGHGGVPTVRTVARSIVNRVA